MIEATCTACGTANIFSDADIAPGAKYALCESCKAKVVLPTKTVAGSGLPGRAPALPPKPATPPARPSVPAIPPIAGPGGKPPPVPVKTPPGGGNAGDVIDLADLPAPKRHGGLAGAVPSRPAPASGLSVAGVAPVETADLPAPKRASGSNMFDDLPAPKATPPSSRQDQSVALDLDDLLAPVGAPIGAAPQLDDLPAPKAAVAPGRFDDLPAPKAAGRFDDLPAPKAAGRFDDLPAPKAAGRFDDLPAPKAGTPPGRFDDLPAPRGPAAAKAPATPGGPDIVDLPGPKGFFDDLPQPAVGGGKSAIDLPAPKGFFDDLPQPAKGGGRQVSDLPAPKGFFDDLPQPSVGRGKSDTGLPAPKGFFDDLPQPTKSGLARDEGTTDEVAPKRASGPAEQPAFQQSGAQPQRAKAASLPGSLFDDIPLPAVGGPATPPAAAPRAHTASTASLDLDGLDLALPSSSAPGPVATPAATNLGRPAAKAGAPMLDLGESSPNLDLGGGGNPNYGDLDLPSPTPVTSAAMAERTAVKFAPGSKDVEPPPSLDLSVGPAPSAKDLSLDLDGESERPRATPAAKGKSKAAAVATEEPTKKKLSPRTVKIVAAATLGLAGLGAGGFVYYRKHAAAQQREQSITDELARATKLLNAGDPGHWKRAVLAAQKVLDLDAKNATALGIVAEASFAGYLEEGTGGAARINAGKRALAAASEAAVNSPMLERARALQALAGEQADGALQALLGASKANPSDATLALYTVWAYLELHQPKAALAALPPVLANPQRRAAGLYARGRANLELGNLDDARKDFSGVLELDKDHIGAQVGLAQAAPPTMAAQREADLMAVLQRKDIQQADVRVVTAAWAMAGDDARRAGRFDAARDRYRKALGVTANDITAQVGLAETELRDNKLDLASELIDKVIALDANHVVANAVAAEIALKRNKLDDAGKKIAALMARNPPISNPQHLARIQTLSGLLLEAQGNDVDALARLRDAVTTAGDRDLGPTIATVQLLGKMAQKADAAKDVAKAEELRGLADQTLAPLASRADKESELTVIIGVSYLSAGNAIKAEEWLRKAVTTRPNDVEAHFQLAEALRLLQRDSESIEALRKAFDLDHSRIDVGVQLARTYEQLGRNDDATQMYDTLLANKESSIELRSRAGRFFARLGQTEKAAAQGAEILKADPEKNAAGFYLRGEGELVAGKLDDARRSFVRAVELEHDPQYLDAHGRASEQLSLKTGDTKYDEEALRAYASANEIAPTMYNPLAGRGRIYVKRHEAVKALEPLVAANKLNPQDAEVMYGIGVAYQEQNQTKAAIAWLARANSIKPTAESANRLGRLYLDSDQAGAAATALTEAVRLAKEKEKAQGMQVPWLTESLYFLGRVESDRRNVGGARRAWEDFLGRNPPNQTQVDEVKRYLANPH